MTADKARGFQQIEDGMSTKAARGTKRSCQNSDCGARFYDLMRDPILCPVCGTPYVLQIHAPTAAAAAVPATPVPEFPLDDGLKADTPVAEGEEALADIEAVDEPAVAADDETFLEEEDEGSSDMTDIVGDAGDEPEEQ